MTIVNDESSVVSEQSFQLIDDARGVIYDRHMFIIQATGLNKPISLLTLVRAKKFYNRCSMRKEKKFLFPPIFHHFKMLTTYKGYFSHHFSWYHDIQHNNILTNDTLPNNT
jgi:hypothetical protein